MGTYKGNDKTKLRWDRSIVVLDLCPIDQKVHGMLEIVPWPFSIIIFWLGVKLKTKLL